MRDNIIILVIIPLIVLAITIPLYINNINNHEKIGDIRINGTWYPKELIK